MTPGMKNAPVEAATSTKGNELSDGLNFDATALLEEADRILDNLSL